MRSKAELGITHSLLCVLFFFWQSREACGILVPRPGIQPVPPAVEAWSLNHWTTREVPTLSNFYLIYLDFICTESWRTFASDLPPSFTGQNFGNLTKNRQSTWTNGISSLEKNHNDTQKRVAFSSSRLCDVWLMWFLKCFKKLNSFKKWGLHQAVREQMHGL